MSLLSYCIVIFQSNHTTCWFLYTLLFIHFVKFCILIFIATKENLLSNVIISYLCAIKLFLLFFNKHKSICECKIKKNHLIFPRLSLNHHDYNILRYKIVKKIRKIKPIHASPNIPTFVNMQHEILCIKNKYRADVQVRSVCVPM